MPDIKHPLPIGTVIKVTDKHSDHGVMSWDDTDTEIERIAPAGSECVITAAEKTTRNGDYQYHVEFIPSEVWNILDQEEVNDPAKYQIVSLGNGNKPDWFNAYYDDPDRPRDPDAVQKIEDENSPKP